MLQLKNNPSGVDFLIQKFQVALHDELLIKWAIDSSSYTSYGRCYRNKKGGSYIAEVYAGNNEYKEVYWDDNLSAVSFFGVSNTERHDIAEKINVHLVFFVNIAALKPTILHRADEEVRKDVQQIAVNEMFGFKYLSTELWLENVLKEYNGSYRDERLKAVDMHPVHCFRINFELNYNKSIC